MVREFGPRGSYTSEIEIYRPRLTLASGEQLDLSIKTTLR